MNIQIKHIRHIFLLSAILILFVCLFLVGKPEPSSEVPALFQCGFSLPYGSGTQVLKVYSFADRNYLFFPSYTDDVRISFPFHHVIVNGETVSSGDSLRNIDLEGEHVFSFYDDADELIESASVLFCKADELPTVSVTSASGRYKDEIRKMQKEYCTIDIINPDGTAEYHNAHPYSDVIRGHGNSTWSADLPKRSYNLYLQFPTDLWRMGESDEWIIIANSLDPSNIRSKFVYDYAETLGLEFSPKSRFVNVYLDGQYHGLYLLCEKTQVAKNRVDIGENGILFTMEVSSRLTGKDNDIVTAQGQQLVREFPPTNNGTWVKRTSDIINAFDSYICSDHPLDDLRQYIDIDSWTKIGIIEELFSDFDAWVTSQYFYIRPESDVIFAGPVWDFDTSSGLSTGPTGKGKTNMPNLLIYKCMTNYMGENSPWYYHLMNNKEFFDYSCRFFSETVYPDFMEYMDNRLDEYERQIRTSDEMNAIRWNCFSASPIEQFKDFLTQRLAFLKRIWTDGEAFHTVTFHNTGISLAFFEGEECLPDIYSFPWFYDEENTLPVESPFFPSSDVELYTYPELLTAS